MGRWLPSRSSGAPVLGQQPVQLRGCRVAGDMDELLLRVRCRQPRQRPHLGEAESASGELIRDLWQVAQCPRDTHVVAAGHQTEAALPCEPVSGGPHPPVAPTLGPVELTDERDEPSRGASDLTRQLDHLGFESLEWPRERIGTDRGRRNVDRHEPMEAPGTDTFRCRPTTFTQPKRFRGSALETR